MIFIFKHFQFIIITFICSENDGTTVKLAMQDTRLKGYKQLQLEKVATKKWQVALHCHLRPPYLPLVFIA